MKIENQIASLEAKYKSALLDIEDCRLDGYWAEARGLEERAERIKNHLERLKRRNKIYA